MAYSYALNTVYNHYLAAYAPKETGRFDTHKKSELRGVYNSIIKLNKESPLSIIDTSEDAQRYAVDLKENARHLKNTIASLGGVDEENLLSQKIAASSNENVVSVKYIGNPDEEIANSSFKIHVEQLAGPQVNTGNYLPMDEMEMEPGAYSFDISVNHMNYEFQFNINEGESNFELQNKLSRLINNSNIGLKAEVKETDNLSALVLESNSTGIDEDAEYLFQVSDQNTSRTAGAVDYLGLDLVSKKAQNAKFYLNDNSSSSYSNHFTVEKTFELNLNSIQSEDDPPVTVGLKEDTDALSENVTRFISGYNEFIKAASQYIGSQPKTSYLLGEMKAISSNYSENLSNMGLNIETNGEISVDADKLKTALQQEDVSSNFTTMKRFATSVLNKSDQVSINPMNYVHRTIVAYKNPGKEYATPYITSQYSGMMFNSYC